LKSYGESCAFSGCNVEAVLDAAHIEPYKGERTNHVQNGLLLRTDIHSLFDLGLIAVESESMTVLVSSTLDGTEYEKLAGRKINLPFDVDAQPSKSALDKHRAESGL